MSLPKAIQTAKAFQERKTEFCQREADRKGKSFIGRQLCGQMKRRTRIDRHWLSRTKGDPGKDEKIKKMKMANLRKFAK
jgi:hypothetical protein